MNNSTLAIFSYIGSDVRLLMIDGEPWWVAADVAAALGIANGRNMVARLDEDQKGVRPVDTLGGVQQLTVINESGLYTAIIRSDSPKAGEFRRWVTGVVLPTIRQTGSYSPTPALTEDQIVQQALTILVAKSAALEAKVTELEPIAAESMTYRQSAGLRTIQDLANDLRTHALANLDGARIIQSDVYDHAGRLGLIIRGDTVRNNQPTAQAIKAGWVKPARTEIEHSSGHTSTKQYARLTPKGSARLWDGCLNYLAEHGTLAIQKAVA